MMGVMTVKSTSSITGYAPWISCVT